MKIIPIYIVIRYQPKLHDLFKVHIASFSEKLTSQLQNGQSLLIIQNMGTLLNLQQKSTTQQFKSQQLNSLAAEFCFERSQVELIYKCFTKLLPKPKAFLQLDDIAMTLHGGHPHFAELPYLQRLFQLLSHRTPGRLFFQDYLTGISTFCLMNSQAILHFVFEWLDTDSNDRITKEDIAMASQYTHPGTHFHTFFNNFLPQVERNLQKNHPFLDFDDFRKLSHRLPYLIWPAYQLQQKLRDINLGAQFWRKQYLKIQKAELSLKNSEKKASRMMEKVKQLSNVAVHKNTENGFIKQASHARVRGVASTDMQLLQTPIRTRRRSAPYIKLKLLQLQQQTHQLISERSSSNLG